MKTDNITCTLENMYSSINSLNLLTLNVTINDLKIFKFQLSEDCSAEIHSFTIPIKLCSIAFILGLVSFNINHEMKFEIDLYRGYRIPSFNIFE